MNPLEFPIDPKIRGRKRTICEVLRRAYQAAEAGDAAAVMPLLDEAHDMAKRMNRKLREYKADWDAGWWTRIE
jgi:hypothetical protein